MAESGGVIRVKGSDGTVKEVTLYTEISDVTEVYKEFKYNGATVYACTTTDPNDEYATEFRYLDTDGVTRYLCTEYGKNLDPTTGTVVINGDLSTDLIINGNIQVSGNISGNAVATGTITYGSLSGSVKANASISECDISVDGGTFTFARDVSKSGSALYTDNMVTNSSDATTVINCDLTIYSSGNRALYNNGGEVTVSSGVTVNSTSTYGHTDAGVYNFEGTFTVLGTLFAAGELYGVNNYYHSTFMVPGVLTAAGGDSGVYNHNSSTFTMSGTMTATGGNFGVENESSTFTMSGTMTATGSDSDSYGFRQISSPASSTTTTLTSTSTSVFTGTTYSVYIGPSTTYTVESGASVTYNGPTYGI